MSRRKVKKGRFLDKTEAEKQMEKTLNTKVANLENALTTKIQERMDAEAVERVGTTQGILAADREAQLGGKIDYGLAKNVALAAQYASNAVASATTGRRMGTIDEVQGDLKLAEELSKKEGIEEGYQLGKTGQAASIDLGKAMAEEKGDLAKRGAMYSTATGFARGALGKIFEEEVPDVQFDPNSQQVILGDPNKLAMNFTSQPGGSKLGDVVYSAKDISKLDPFRSGLSFTT